MSKRLGLGIVLSAVLVAVLPVRAEIIEQILVKVNGDILTLTDFEARQVSALRDLARERPELTKVSQNSPQFAQAVAEVTPQLILSSVDELLWIQRAKEHGWELTRDRITEIINNIRKQNNLEDDAAFRKALQTEGLSEEQLRRDIETRALVDQAQSVDVVEKIEVSDEEVRTYYETNRQQFTTPPEITLREILIPVPTSDRGINVAQSDEARARAEDVRSRLVAGEPFPRLAGEVSSAGSKANGGLLPALKLDDLAPALQSVFSSMKVGDITPVMQTTSGFQIFKLESKNETKIRPLDDARNEIFRRLVDQKRDGELAKYTEKLRSQAKISWRNPELQKAYNQALSDRQRRLGVAPADPAPQKP
jgi:peptidyl-prolyl cis-trans isomerase SurA